MRTKTGLDEGRETIVMSATGRWRHDSVTQSRELPHFGPFLEITRPVVIDYINKYDYWNSSIGRTRPASSCHKALVKIGVHMGCYILMMVKSISAGTPQHSIQIAAQPQNPSAPYESKVTSQSQGTPNTSGLAR